MYFTATELAFPAVTTALASFVLVGIVRLMALRHGVLDHPTERSSHATATPRGGGLGVMLAALAMCAWRAVHPPAWAVLATLVGATCVAVVGWTDDRRSLPVRTRLGAHGLAALAVGSLAIGSGQSASIAIAVFLWWTFWTVSSINLVNFMDGINGLVALQVAVFACSLALYPASGDTAAYYAAVVAGACVGFLPWNFPHARIFLGDVGSGGLGYLVPVLALLTMRSAEVDIVRAHLPLFPLFGDAVTTMFRRWRRGERLTQAHRSHLYQRLANGRMGHTRVTVIYTTAAVAGAFAAHADRVAGAFVWAPAFVTLTVIGGAVLDRRADDAARSWM
jgi:UDP-N-acetylmuramyl pentapeptide phosphotransferase/UDP-N-acetylglucosamine-1-phosphate transferase